MKARSQLEDPVYWRTRAEEARRMADRVTDAVAQRSLRDIAASYEELAKLAEARSSGNR
jgi:hypothetical protein